MRVEDLRQALKGAGWQLVNKAKHELWVCPCGDHTMALPRGRRSLRRRQTLNYIRSAKLTGCRAIPEEW